jgi:hypothetical protein
MLVTVLDGNGISQQLIIASQESVSDVSGVIAVTDTSQPMLAANALRSGYSVQNNGSNVMRINDTGNSSTLPGSFTVPPLGFFPPPGYPISTGAINISGTIGDNFSAREW